MSSGSNDLRRRFKADNYNLLNGPILNFVQFYVIIELSLLINYPRKLENKGV